MKQFISVELTMTSEQDGGRINPLSSGAFGGTYRPHIVIGDPNQRKAILIEKDGHPNYIDEKYQGVAFWSGPDSENIPVGSTFNAELDLMYYPDNQYIDVISGATFTLREGAKVVGFGKVLDRWENE